MALYECTGNRRVAARKEGKPSRNCSHWNLSVEGDTVYLPFNTPGFLNRVVVLVVFSLFPIHPPHTHTNSIISISIWISCNGKLYFICQMLCKECAYHTSLHSQHIFDLFITKKLVLPLHSSPFVPLSIRPLVPKSYFRATVFTIVRHWHERGGQRTLSIVLWFLLDGAREKRDAKIFPGKVLNYK